MFHTTRGLVLREVHYKEADRILTILTEDEGKISAKARGALRTKSKTAAATQLLCYSDLTLFGSHGMWTVNEATELEQFRGLRSDIELLALGVYIAEMLESTSDEDCPEPAILQLGLNSLYALSSRLCPQEQVKAAFELRLMCLAGYTPELSVCASCGAEEPAAAWFSPANGEIRCDNCRADGMVELTPAVLAAMRHIVGSEPKRVFSFNIDKESLERLGKICESYALYQLERPFSSLIYYKNIKR